jgi:uncharacterized protein (DUF1697 family)
MPTHVAFLRAVNVGGVKVPMAELRDVAGALGLADVATHLNSGNLLFSTADAAGAVAARLEEALQERFDRPIPVMVRSAAELASVLERVPYDRAAHDDKTVHLGFLSAPPEEQGVIDAIPQAAREQVVVDGREAFLLYPDGLGRSKLTNAVLEKRLRVLTTVRGVRTVAGLLDRC